jgi:glucans biosynthesis protein
MTINPLNASDGLLMKDSASCGARTREGYRCKRPNAVGRSRCNLHGGAPGSGAPSGERNGRFRHGDHTKIAIDERKWLKQLIKTLVIEKVRNQ